jgi:catechol 2,3-dioxygenase-like lactoylglutathione lyase family enzyme
MGDIRRNIRRSTMPHFSYDHVHLVSADPVKAAEWYKKAFDAKTVAVGKYPDGGDRVELTIEGSRILIRSQRDAKQSANDVPKSRRGLHVVHFKPEVLKAAVAYIKGKGIPFLEEPRLSLPSGHTVAFLMAPDNVMIELVEEK